MSEARDITQLLQAASAGDRRASDALFEAVYQELRTIAKAQRHRWHGNETMNTTALIHEAYLKLANKDLENYTSRAHFFATASKAMRQVLINYADRIATAKRGSNPVKVTMTELASADAATFDDLSAMWVCHECSSDTVVPEQEAADGVEDDADDDEATNNSRRNTQTDWSAC